MMSVKVIGLVFVVLVVFEFIGQTQANVKLPIRIPNIRRWRMVSKRILCSQVYGLACKTAEIDTKDVFQPYLIGTGCKVSLSSNCAPQERSLESTTPEGLKYVPLPPRFENYDKDGDQKITYDEFTTPILAHYQIQNYVALKEMFNAADVDADGVLESDEFAVAPFVQAEISTA